MKNMKVMTRYIFYIFRFAVIALVSLIPKNKNIWVFGAWFGHRFADNPKYLFNRVRALRDFPVRVIWICKDKQLINRAKRQYGLDLDIYYHLSLKGIYYQVVAKIAFVGHSINTDLNGAFIGITTKRIQLWHGIPLKKIGLDDNLTARKWHRTWVYQYLNNNFYDYMVSTGKKVSSLFATAFSMPLDRIIETGYPRNDVFISDKKYKIESSLFQVIYMPTFRDKIGDEVSLFNSDYFFDFEKLIDFLVQHRICLTLRTHPVNRPPQNIIDKVGNSRYIKISSDDDIYDVIGNYDCLITDYSSIMFDFCLSKKPIIFAPFDIEKYLLLDRDMYFDYSKLISGYPVAGNWDELLVILKAISVESNLNKIDTLIKFHDAHVLEGGEFSMQLVNFIMNKWYRE